MTLTNGNHVISYGMTAKGQLFEHHQVGSKGIIRTTTKPEQFLRWMIASEIDADTRDWLERMKIKRRKGGGRC